jgi:hypothetical protein
MGGQQRAGVPGPAQGGVHQDRALGLKRGAEQREDAVPQDRHVAGGAHRTPLSLDIQTVSLFRTYFR